MADIETGDIVYRLNGSWPMKVIGVDCGVAIVSFARADGSQKRVAMATTLLTRHKRPNGHRMFVLVKGGLAN